MSARLGLALALLLAAPVVAWDEDEEAAFQPDVDFTVPASGAKDLPRNTVLFAKSDETSLRATVHSAGAVTEPDVRLLVPQCRRACAYLIQLQTGHNGMHDVILAARRADTHVLLDLGDDVDDSLPQLPGTPTATARFVPHGGGLASPASGGTHTITLEFAPPVDDRGIGAIGVWDVTQRLGTDPVAVRLERAGAEAHKVELTGFAADKAERRCFLVRAWDLAGNLSANTQAACVDLTDETSGGCSSSEVSSDPATPIFGLLGAGLPWLLLGGRRARRRPHGGPVTSVHRA